MIQKFDFVRLIMASFGHPIGAIAKVDSFVNDVVLRVKYLGEKHYERIRIEKVERISLSAEEMQPGEHYVLIDAFEGRSAGTIVTFVGQTITSFAGDCIVDGNDCVLPYVYLMKKGEE